MSLFTGTAFFNLQPASAGGAAQWNVRSDAYASSVVIAMPGTQVAQYSMPNYYSDISATIRNSGTNVSIIPSGSTASARLWASASVVSSGSYSFSGQGYQTSVFTSGSQNAGNLPSGVIALGTQPFVIEYWINYSGAFNQPPFNKGISAPGNSPNVFDFPGFVPRYRVILNDGQYFFPQSQAQDTWYHVAFVRTSAGQLYLYINGTRHSTTFTIGTGLNVANTAYQLMGLNSGATNDGAPSRFNDLRITVGSDRGYTGSTITVPNSIIYYQ